MEYCGIKYAEFGEEQVEIGTFIEGNAIEYRFEVPGKVTGARIVWDSELNRESMPRIGDRPFVHNMMCNKPLDFDDFHVPCAMTRAYRIEGVRPDGKTEIIFKADNNYQRLNRIALEGEWAAVRLIPEATWGAAESSDPQPVG